MLQQDSRHAYKNPVPLSLSKSSCRLLPQFPLTVLRFGEMSWQAPRCAKWGSESFIISFTCKGLSGSFISVFHSGCVTHFVLFTRLLSSNWWGSSITASINLKEQVSVGCRATEDVGPESPWEVSEHFQQVWWRWTEVVKQLFPLLPLEGDVCVCLFAAPPPILMQGPKQQMQCSKGLVWNKLKEKRNEKRE